MGCFVVAEFLLTNASCGPSAIAEPLVEQLVSSGELICVVVQNFNKIGQSVWIYRNFLTFKMATDSEILKLLVAHQLGRPNMHRHAKFH